MNDILREIEKSQLREHKVKFQAGDTLRVHVRIKEGDKERVQVFQGTVIAKRGSGTGATFTVRKMSAGIGVERVFPMHSPNLVKIERLREGAALRDHERCPYCPAEGLGIDIFQWRPYRCPPGWPNSKDALRDGMRLPG